MPYLAHRIDPTEDKLCAIRDASVPQDAKTLRSFLGLIMFYNKFLTNHSTVLSALNKLLCKDQQWCWTNVHDKAFQNAKKLLIDSSTLVHYDDSKPLCISCHASAYGRSGGQFHRINGSDRPVAFASCTLTKSQRNYSELDKEACSIIFCFKRFHQFLYGRLFHIITDHNPLLQLLGEHKHVPVHTAARLQRYSLIIVSYNYKLEFRSTKHHIDADAMSRVPVSTTIDSLSDNVNCNVSDTVTDIDKNCVKRLTQRDPVLSRVYHYIVSGWPEYSDPLLTPYRTRRDELSTEAGCILWGQRVIIPPTLHRDV